MKLHRFYIQEDLSVGKELSILDPNKIHQWLSVFRFGTGDKIVLFNGNGKDFEAEFLELHKKKAVIRVGAEKESIILSKEIHLKLAIIKKDLFELVVEKATELGVASITPIITERVQVKNLNMDRLQKIAIEASEQCGRSDVPVIYEAVSLLDSFGQSEHIYVCDMDGKDIQSIEIQNPATLYIGPEGGWSEGDREVFKKPDVSLVSLGSTVLRAETAAIVGVAKFI